MITLYSGTPGSGKSLHLARKVADELCLRKKTVIANFPVNMAYLTKNGKKKIGRFIYLPNHEITVDYLIAYAQEHHRIGVEGQTLIVIDEAGIMFNSRESLQFDRKAWVHFFMTHRHYGFNVILVAQFDRMLDRQIRAFIEYDVKHRKANNFRTLGLVLTLLHIPVFVAITYWYGIRERCGADFFFYRKRDSKLYDTMMLFGGDRHGQKIGDEKTAASADGDAEACEGGAPSSDAAASPEQDLSSDPEPGKEKVTA